MDGIGLLNSFPEIFANLHLPSDAQDYLLALWDVTQVFDDVADGDSVEREALDRAIWQSLYGMPTNSFYIRHAHVLLPLVAVQILKWKGSDTAERNGGASARSYMWRAGFYDIVLMVVQLCHGEQTALRIAHDIMALYGEDYADYLGEFNGA